MNEKRIYAITGLPASGKTSAAMELREWGIYPVIDVREKIDELQSDYSGSTFNGMKDAVESLSEEYGNGSRIYPCLSEISMALSEMPGVIVDGILSLQELKKLDSFFDAKIIIISIEAKEDRRVSYLRDAGDYDETYEQDIIEGVVEWDLEARDKIAKDHGVDETMKSSDFTVYNNTDLHDLGICIAAIEDVVCDDSDEIKYNGVEVNYEP